MASPYGQISKSPEYIGTEGRGPAISDQLGMLGKNVEVLQEIISKLESRLDVVLRPAGPDRMDNKIMERPPIAVPLAGVIADQNQALSVAHSRLHALIDRIEL
jgi:hypothetical protein